MDDKLRQKLERYLLHSKEFLFGLSEGENDYSAGRQRRIYDYLSQQAQRNWGVEIHFKGTYDSVTRHLLEDPRIGIERVVKDILVSRVHSLFPAPLLNELREYWQNGYKPDEAFLNRYRLNRDTAFPFLLVTDFGERNYGHKNVDEFGPFAGIWFEEIEQLLR